MKKFALFLVFVVFCVSACKGEKIKSSNANVENLNSSPNFVNAEKSGNIEESEKTKNAQKQKLVIEILKKLNLPSANFIQQNLSEFLIEFEEVYTNDKDYLLVLVDKTHHLPKTYKPEDLVSLSSNDYYSVSRNDLSLRIPVENALRLMAKEALKENVWLLVSSTFRSYEYQEKLFARWVEIDGLEEAERSSARAGTSQHQLGTAIDFGSIDDSFAETKAGKWLEKNAENYGFSLSFPQGYENVTGYRWECWHYRYIGVEACKLQKKWFNNIQQYMMEFIDAWERNGGNNL